jgi:hypothetical protein
MKAIGNTFQSMARSVQRKAQTLRHALPETHLVQEALQGVGSLAAQATARLRGHRPVELIGELDASTLDVDPDFDEVRTRLVNALPELRYTPAERRDLVLKGSADAVNKETIEARIGHLREAVDAFPAPEPGEVTDQDRQQARQQTASIREQVKALDELMGLSHKGMSAGRKSAIRGSIEQLHLALDHAEAVFPA